MTQCAKTMDAFMELDSSTLTVANAAYLLKVQARILPQSSQPSRRADGLSVARRLCQAGQILSPCCSIVEQA